ncbi:hypothetical protein HK102_006727, partial [Quaeritorhiza haematococci]
MSPTLPGSPGQTPTTRTVRNKTSSTNITSHAPQNELKSESSRPPRPPRPPSQGQGDLLFNKFVNWKRRTATTAGNTAAESSKRANTTSTTTVKASTRQSNRAHTEKEENVRRRRRSSPPTSSDERSSHSDESGEDESASDDVGDYGHRRQQVRRGRGSFGRFHADYEDVDDHGRGYNNVSEERDEHNSTIAKGTTDDSEEEGEEEVYKRNRPVTRTLFDPSSSSLSGSAFGRNAGYEHLSPDAAPMNRKSADRRAMNRVDRQEYESKDHDEEKDVDQRWRRNQPTSGALYDPSSNSFSVTESPRTKLAPAATMARTANSSTTLLKKAGPVFIERSSATRSERRGEVLPHSTTKSSKNVDKEEREKPQTKEKEEVVKKNPHDSRLAELKALYKQICSLEEELAKTARSRRNSHANRTGLTTAEDRAASECARVEGLREEMDERIRFMRLCLKLISQSYPAATKYDIETRMWKNGVYALVDELKTGRMQVQVQSRGRGKIHTSNRVQGEETGKQSSGGGGDRAVEADGLKEADEWIWEWRTLWTDFLSRAEAVYEDLVATLRKVSDGSGGSGMKLKSKSSGGGATGVLIWHRAVCYLGDIARYSTLLPPNIPSDAGSDGTTTKIPNGWDLARQKYKEASMLAPYNGFYYNQLAMVASSASSASSTSVTTTIPVPLAHLTSLYYYLRALSVPRVPFSNAREALTILFGAARKKCAEALGCVGRLNGGAGSRAFPIPDESLRELVRSFG